MDKRLLRVDVEVGNTLKTFEDVKISASGSKVSNEIPNEFNITLVNLNKNTRDKILTETNILDRNLPPKKCYVYAGRQSTGYNLIFKGDIRQTTPTQPPDIGLTITTYTGDNAKYLTTVRSGGEMIKLSVLSRQIANKLGLKLLFEATDKQIGSYSYTGSALGEVSKLNEIANVDAYVDDDTLVVRNENVPLRGRVFKISKNNGMIGLPTINERGITVKIMFDARITVGSQIDVESEILPTANGSWTVYKITYDLQNRDQSFYMILDATRSLNA